MEAVTMLYKRWWQCAGACSSDQVLIAQLYDELIRAYAQPSRHYHTQKHIEALLAWSGEYKSQLQHPTVVDFAIFYHDAVYKASRSDNEEQSARIAKERLAQLHFPMEEINAVSEFILATKTHTLNTSVYAADLMWFLDFDLSILGAEEEAYFEYVKQIRSEFKIYPDLLYKPGRRKVLQHFLNKEFIFKTEEFRTRFEEKAKMNLRQELERLT